MTSKKLFCYLFIGAPGVGKGTFAKILCRELGMEHIAIGDLIRDEIRNDKSKYREEFQKYVTKGELIPDQLVNALAIDKVKTSTKSIILDGFPRNIQQADVLNNELSNMNNRKILAVNIALDREVTIEKLLGRVLCKTCKDEFNFANIARNGYMMPALMPNPSKCKLGVEKCNFVEERRADDNIETITKRLEEYENKTAPLIKYYSDKNLMYTFNVKKGVADAPDIMKLIVDVSK